MSLWAITKMFGKDKEVEVIAFVTILSIPTVANE